MVNRWTDRSGPGDTSLECMLLSDLCVEVKLKDIREVQDVQILTWDSENESLDLEENSRVG